MSRTRAYWLKRIRRETGAHIRDVCAACRGKTVREIVAVYFGSKA